MEKNTNNPHATKTPNQVIGGFRPTRLRLKEITGKGSELLKTATAEQLRELGKLS